MKTVTVVPGTQLKSLIDNQAPIGDIAEEVRKAATASGLSGEVGVLIDVPYLDGRAVTEVPTTFNQV